jgi:hypothetical protein
LIGTALAKENLAEGLTMRDRSWLPLVIALVLVSTGCATEREWAVWRAHPTHFATDNHLGFSVTNAVAGAPRVTPELMARAKGEGWWGRFVPSDVDLAKVAGSWEGSWSGYGMMRSQRGGVASATFSQNGATGEGRLVLMDAMVAEGVPVALREGSSFGAAVEVAVSETEVWVNGAEARRPFAASFILQGDKLVGTFLYTNSPVRIELVRQR